MSDTNYIRKHLKGLSVYVILILLAVVVMINMNESYLEALYRKHGHEKGLDPMLLKAIAIVESSENPEALNPNDPSYGLMQIRYVEGKTHLDVMDFPPPSIEQLYDPDYNLHIASQILAWNISNFGFVRGIAIYNCWTCKDDPIEGPFKNQPYVSKVLQEYKSLGGKVDGSKY